jgi:hypothetical protein
MTLKCSYSTFRKRYFNIIISGFALVIGLIGCKITYSLTGASISPDVKTISIQYFQNRASLVQPALSQYITDKLISKCKSQTNLNFISGAGDVNFDGEITEYNTVPLTVSGNEQAAMNRFTISVKVKFTNIIQPEMSYDQVFSRYADYDSSKDLSQVEQQLSEKIVELIIEDIFNKAFANW